MRIGLVAALVALGMGIAPAPASAEAASVDIVSVSGAGGRVTFSYTSGSGRLCVDTVLELQASTSGQHLPPGAPVVTPYLGVSVSQYKCGSGRLLFTGQGVLVGPDLTVGGNLETARLRANLTARSSVDAATRAVALDVAWTPTGPVESMVSNEHVTLPGVVVNTHHDGSVRLAEAASITIADPASTAAPIAVQVRSVAAALWDTADKRITETGDAATSVSTSASTQLVATATATSTSGYWSGYWTWNPITRTWNWTWVWYNTPGSFITS